MIWQTGDWLTSEGVKVNTDYCFFLYCPGCKCGTGFFLSAGFMCLTGCRFFFFLAVSQKHFSSTKSTWRQAWCLFNPKQAAHALWYGPSCGGIVLHCDHYAAWQHIGSLHVRSLRLFAAIPAAITATAIFQQAATSLRPKTEGGQKSTNDMFLFVMSFKLFLGASGTKGRCHRHVLDP